MTALATSKPLKNPTHAAMLERAAVTLVKNLGLIPYPSLALSGPSWFTLHAGKSQDLMNGWSLRVTAEDAGHGIIGFRVGVIIATNDETWNMGRGRMDARIAVPILSWRALNADGTHVPPLLDSRQIEEIERAFDKRYQKALRDNRATQELKTLNDSISSHLGGPLPAGASIKARQGEHGPEVHFEFAVSDPVRAKAVLEFLKTFDAAPTPVPAAHPTPARAKMR